MINKNNNDDISRLYRILMILIAVALVILIILGITAIALGRRTKNPDTSDAGGSDNTVPVIPDTGSENPDEFSDSNPPVTTKSPVTQIPETTTEKVTTNAPEHTTGYETKKPPPEVTTGSASTGYIYTSLAGIEDSFPGTVLTGTADMGVDYLNKIVFLGDSLTYGLRVYGVLPDGKSTDKVWVPSNGTLTLNNVKTAKILEKAGGSPMTVTRAAELRKPEIMIITLGTNGISFLNESEFKAEFRDLVKAIKASSPDTKIILQSIFPVTARYVNQSSINNEKICRANIWLCEVADELGVYYLNTTEILVDFSTGYLYDSYQSGDGMHLTAAAYKKILEFVRTHAVTE